MTAAHHSPAGKGLRASLAALSLALTPLLVGLPASPAQAAGNVSVSSALGNGVAAADAPTTVTVSGTNMQSIPKAFGGIYVVFGYAPNTSSWGPSQGGVSGKEFFYVADSQAKDNAGYQRFVAFPGSSTADSANGGTISADGSFSLSMVIPGATFSAETADGSSQTIDCRDVQCGIFTFGAHGVINANNESFTPVSFGAPAANPAADAPALEDSSATDAGAGAAAGDTAGGTSAGAAADPVPVATATSVPQATTTGKATLGVTQKTVVAGNVLSFTGQGFAPGEQVAATLASGEIAAGPVVAGVFGEIAGAVQIPVDLAAGTHKLTLIGAGSKSTASVEFSVMANPAMLVTADQESNGTWWALIAVIIAGAILLLIVLISLVTALTRRKRSKALPDAPAPTTTPAQPARQPVPVPLTEPALQTEPTPLIDHTRELV